MGALGSGFRVLRAGHLFLGMSPKPYPWGRTPRVSFWLLHAFMAPGSHSLKALVPKLWAAFKCRGSYSRIVISCGYILRKQGFWQTSTLSSYCRDFISSRYIARPGAQHSANYSCNCGRALSKKGFLVLLLGFRLPPMSLPALNSSL